MPGTDGFFSAIVLLSWLCIPAALWALLRRRQWSRVAAFIAVCLGLWIAFRAGDSVDDAHLRLWLAILVVPLVPIPFFLGFAAVSMAVDAAEGDAVPKRLIAPAAGERRKSVRAFWSHARLRGLFFLLCAFLFWAEGAVNRNLSNNEGALLVALYLGTLAVGGSLLLFEHSLWGLSPHVLRKK